MSLGAASILSRLYTSMNTPYSRRNLPHVRLWTATAIARRGANARNNVRKGVGKNVCHRIVIVLLLFRSECFVEMWMSLPSETGRVASYTDQTYCIVSFQGWARGFRESKVQSLPVFFSFLPLGLIVDGSSSAVATGALKQYWLLCSH